MSFNSTDLAFFWSANGGPDDARDLNLGGVISATEIIHGGKYNWAPDVPRTVLGPVGSSGTWYMYFPFYIKNNHASITVTDVYMEVYKDSSNINVDIKFGKDPAGQNGTAQTIANNTTEPTNVSWQNAVDYIFGFPIVNTLTISSSMAPGDYVPAWFSTYGPKGISSIPAVTFGIKCTFTRPA